ncbi:prepilin-type N-terminal cleavage/methylation domain-containing protein [Clostridium aceticum]|uniref:Prepilin-type N-terminal cleavage/methylation domain-containing protein n=1 Tax=Clostridium aceticum TaxID=84022 RepID=A0A0D8IDQ7_9CLOT|nr:type II secretion system protein [Clostridium aceticum]AKL95274.1 prepilin-type N-terminal cleavage/methylation domain-containing protein [Clostridium aceticum]KJF28122.1 hypothetical protein TZ02_06150 [Clostridium aceticum]
MGKNQYFCNKKGFTLVEIIVSLALLGMIAVMILPIFVFGIKSSVFHRTTMSAAQIASNQLEWLRTLDYDDDLGLVGGYTPSGIVNENLFQNKPNTDPYVVDGVEYRVRTRISWEDDVSITGRQVDDARKKVDVVVYAYNPFTKAESEYSLLGTMFTFEGQGSPTTPGIRVYVSLGDAPGAGVHRALIEMTGDAGNLAFTDVNGRAVFPNLPQGVGNYFIKPLSWDYPAKMMVRPHNVEDLSNYNDQRWIYSRKAVGVPSDVSFCVDFPGYLQFLNNTVPNILIWLNPYGTEADGIREPNPAPTPPRRVGLTTSLEKLKEKIVELWPHWQYEYELISPTGSPLNSYYLATKEDGFWQELQQKFSFNAPTNNVVTKDVLLHMGFKYVDKSVSSLIESEKVKRGDIIIIEEDDAGNEVERHELPYIKMELSFTDALSTTDSIRLQFSDEEGLEGNVWEYNLEDNQVTIFRNESLADLENWDDLGYIKNHYINRQESDPRRVDYSIEGNHNKLIITILDTEFNTSDSNGFYSFINEISSNQLYINIPNPESDDFDKTVKSSFGVPLWGYTLSDGTIDVSNSKSYGFLMIKESKEIDIVKKYQP